jgi:hypothetical protein
MERGGLWETALLCEVYSNIKLQDTIMGRTELETNCQNEQTHSHIQHLLMMMDIP